MHSVPSQAAQPLPLIEVNQGEVQQHLDGLVRASVEQTLNALLDAEADALCGARRYERSPDRVDTRAGYYVSARRITSKAEQEQRRTGG